MALNRTDTRQRAYMPIAACNPAGNWIDEKQYNRFRAKGVLVGNWEEEEQLSNSMGAVAHTIQTKPTPKSPHEPRRGLHMHQVPNFQSSIFLTNSKLDRKSHYDTESATQFRGQQLPPPRVGARSAMLRSVLEQTARDQVDVEPEQFPSSAWESTYNSQNTALPLKYPEAPDPDLPADAYLTLPHITIHNYKAKFSSGSTFNTGDNPFKRNTNFSTPITSYNKSQTPIY